MIEGTHQGVAKFARVKVGLPHFAEVAVVVDPAAGDFAVDLRCSGLGWTGQGYLEDAPAHGYDDWKAGATVGATSACGVAGLAGARVTVERISGLLTDTNPTIVAAAAALAVWNAIGFQPPPPIFERLEAQVFASWQRPAGEPVDFSFPA